MISPNFPTTYWRFAEALKQNGLNVLGVGDTPYDQLSLELKNNLTEYYFLPDLNNYQELYRAIAFLSFKYGKIDWLESNNEYWLETDAKLREDFNIQTGADLELIEIYKQKSRMKEFFKKAKVPTARYIMVDNLDKALKFIKKVGYPVFAKPNVGVGANHTYKINNLDELKSFYSKKHDFEYIIEEFVDGQVVSFDGIADSKGNTIFCSSSEFPIPNFEIVNNNVDDFYYTVPTIDPEFEAIGRKVIKAFKVKKRFFHVEFFRLRNNQKGLGKKGDIIGLEVNMRPAGGFTPEMINIANSISVYQVYADVIVYDKNLQKQGKERYFVAEVARRDATKYVNSNNDILQRYNSQIFLHGRYPKAISVGMGEQYFIAKFAALKEVNEFKDFCLKHKP
jgi:hypothetical protein